MNEKSIIAKLRPANNNSLGIKMIVVTGGAGFIGSAIVWRLNNLEQKNIIIVDELGTDEKWKNISGLIFDDFIDKSDFIGLLDTKFKQGISAIVHMGAISSTTEKDASLLLKNNYEYTRKLAEFCIRTNARFIYASSAATYGGGEKGFDDSEDEIRWLRPLNMYGYSKHLFDLWALKENLLGKIAGLKYFNVYGPNEYHKGDMRSLVHKAFEQVLSTGKVKLFKSGNPAYGDGEQKRDFLYVNDAVEMTLFFLNHPGKNGIFNVGSGTARTWNDLVKALFSAMNKPLNIEYIEMPEHLADKYQYFTEAKMDKLKKAGYVKPVFSLEDGVTDYVKNYLLKDKYLGNGVSPV